eukprot:Gb_06072 [translate_table: standard]
MGDVGKKENNTQPRLKRPPAKNNARRVCFSFAAYAKNVIDHLRRCQVPIARGLTDEEFDRIETTFSFTFPPDLRSILQEGLPVGVGFPNWRSGATQQLRMMMDLPMAGLSCEISKGRFWWRDWGSQPSNTEAALEIARNYFRQAPVLVPIYSHCYIPCSPNLAGNPIFFVYQKDIFYCGYDVADFFEREAFIPHNFKPPADQEFESDGGTSVRELIKEAEGDFERRFGNPETGMVKNWTEKNNSAVEPHEEKWEEFKRNPENWGKSSLPKISTRNKEIPGRKSVSGESSRSAIERPEPLVRSAGNSPRNGQAIISRYKYFHEKPLSNNVRNRFTIQAPAWVAKAARRIEFWSDLVENKGTMNIAPPEGLFSSVKVDVDLAKSSRKQVRWDDLTVVEVQHRFSRKWLASYLGDLESRLRNGGWKEDDISDMINPPAASFSSRNQVCKGSDRHNLMESLAFHVDLLSISLRKAGWSAKDVVESLDFDPKQQRKIPPHFAAKIGQIAEYLVKA